jgi:uncharacterized protein (DUF1697 family)
MKTYVILLRGLMPTGKNKVLMAPLRQALVDAGLVDVRTYIQSGNVIARSVLGGSQVEKLVHHEIEKHFGGDIAVLARTPLQVRQIFADNPFKDVDGVRVYFTILGRKPAQEKINFLASQEFPPDRFIVTNEAVYIHCPVADGLTKLNNNFIERTLGVFATTRNHRTMTKLIELLQTVGSNL